MTPLNLPPYDYRLRTLKGRQMILANLRHRFVALTPEEWVRQHFVHFLVDHKGYPSALLGNEVALQIGDKTLRADTVLYTPTIQPRMIVEYKAPTIEITQKVFDQIVAYNLLLHADYLIVSNGMHHYCCKIDYEKRGYTFLKDIPVYSQL